MRALLAGHGWDMDRSATPIYFEREEGQLLADTPDQLDGVLAALDDVAASGDRDLLAIGFITYEAGVWLEGSTSLFRSPEGTPLAAFGIYRLQDAVRRAPAPQGARFTLEERATAQVSLSPREWDRGVEEIRSAISRGDVYQVNLTRRTRLCALVDPFAVAGTLFRENPVPYAFTLADEGWAVVSNSPELFLDADLTAGWAASAPIKGTIAREGTSSLDEDAKGRLVSSAKDAAEHVMIVDLIRNDLGRAAVPGGISVPRFREVKTFRHLHHLESTVAARLAPGVAPSDLFRATLPGGSITGAPKRAALRCIREIEPCPRGAYTGAAGFVRGDERAVFNVSIRTAILHDGLVDYHAGGGIVWDSDPAAESAEVETKSREFHALLPAGPGSGGESG